MPLPLPKNAIKMLGKRLADSPEPTEDDLALLEELIQCHSDVLAVATPRLADLPESGEFAVQAVTNRAKTTQTIIEKLRRQPNMDLARMQDLAGIRVVGQFTLEQQDALAAEVMRRFPADPREPRLVDRRAAPSWGYRAVHVIATVDDVSVEIQIRTIRQHLWANLTERLGDTLGRGIRYGESPQSGQSLLQKLAQGLTDLSERLYDIERDPAGSARITTEDGQMEPATAEAVAAFGKLLSTGESS